MNKRSIPLPCNEEEYKAIKIYCLVNGVKYKDLTKLLINVIQNNK